MKKLAFALLAASALLFGVGLVAQAYAPPGGAITTPANPGPGQPFTTTVNCTAGAGDVTFSFTGNIAATLTVACTPGSGTASVMGFLTQTPTGTATATFTAPTAPGTYSGTATQGGQQVGAFTIVIAQAATTTVPVTTAAPGATTVAPAVTTISPTVPGGGLPATGSGGMGTMTGIAIGLLVVGAGLFIVAQVRRRETSAA